MRFLKFLIALFILIPLCIIFTRTAGLALFGTWPTLFDWQRPWFYCFLSGMAVWTLVFFLLPRPMWVYVFGHELTHAMWAWLFGGKIFEMKVTTEGGLVRTDKSNFLIVLAPYFFPVYVFLVLIGWFVAGLFFNLDGYLPGLFFLLGAAYGFHITFTAMMIPMVQSDITSQGWLFSLSTIFLLNLLPLAVFLLALVPDTDWALLPLMLRDSAVWFVKKCDAAITLIANFLAGRGG